MKVERWSAYIILCLIVAVATFNILGSLSMSVIEKKRDIGILRSMGASEKSITKIFMYEGLLIGIIGTLAGLLIGYFICYLQLHYNIYPLDPTQYKIDSLPLQIRMSDFFFVAGASMLLTFLASSELSLMLCSLPFWMLNPVETSLIDITPPSSCLTSSTVIV